jgi:YegS/Rv2252/BmrU family lipid kinase
MEENPAAQRFKRVPVIVNDTAGTGHCQETYEEIRRLFRARGVEADILAARDGSGLEARAREALRENPGVVVAAGGDGTVSAIASALRGTGVALGIVPIGTLNHFARDLGIPADLEGAIDVILAGTPVAVDVGEVNGVTFINNASLGIYPDIVRDRTRQQRRLGRGKYWAMLWATFAVMRRSPWLKLHLDIDGRRTDCRSPFVFVGNNDYTMEGFNIGMRSSLRDGCLSIYTTQRRTRLGLLGLALRALLGRLRQADDFAVARAEQLTIDSRHRRLWIATDGEISVMQPPLAFRVLPRALEVIVPRPA